MQTSLACSTTRERRPIQPARPSPDPRWQPPRKFGGHKLDLELCAQTRTDLIDGGIFCSARRTRLSIVRDDDVTKARGPLFAESIWHLSDSSRAPTGLRAEALLLNVVSDNPLNTGQSNDAIASPKASLVFIPSARMDLCARAGDGLHRNDARSGTIRVDPADGVTPVARVDPLVRK